MKNRNKRCTALHVLLLCAVLVLMTNTGCKEIINNTTNTEPPPLEMGYRDAFWGGKGDLVAVIKNTSDERLVGTVKMTDPAGNSQTFSLDLLPHDSQEIGWMEGWNLRRGDEAKVSIPGYRTVVWSFND